MLVGLKQKMAETGGELVHEKLAARSSYRMLKKNSVLATLVSSLNPQGSLLARSAEHLFPHKNLKKLKEKFISVSLHVFCLL